MNLLQDRDPDLSGLEQSRSGRLGALTKIKDGFAVFEGTPSVAVYNPIGSVHPGYAAAILVSACGRAVHAQIARPGYSTIGLKVPFHKASTTATSIVRCEGSVISFGRRIAFSKAN